jgi:5'-AMP-activated protein kinase catalytic alpha subunit
MSDNIVKAKNYYNLGIALPSSITGDLINDQQSSAQILSGLLSYLSPLTPQKTSAIPSGIQEEQSPSEEMIFSSSSIADIEDEDLRKAFEKDLGAVLLQKFPNFDKSMIMFEIPGYLFYKEIGSGAYSTVYLGVHIATNEKVAVKRMEKSKVLHDENSVHRVLKEIAVHKQLKHQNICELLEVHQDEMYIDLIMEYCDKGEMYDIVKKHVGLNEKDARYYFCQLLDAVSYCHSKNVAHRDIKLENLMINNEGKLKLIDFGLTDIFGPDKLLHVQCGSTDYLSPEMIMMKSYDAEKNDVWSLGVVLFAMVTGELPFTDKKISKTYSKIAQVLYSYPKGKNVSDSLKNLISLLLVADPEKRLCLDQIYHHEWVNIHKRISESVPDIRIVSHLKERLFLAGFSEEKIHEYFENPEPSPMNACYRLLFHQAMKEEDLNIRLLPLVEDLTLGEQMNIFRE